MSKFINHIVVGIDVSKDFHYVAILSPDGTLFKKEFKILNSSVGFCKLIEEIKIAEATFNTPSAIFMESTGIYHLSLFRYLKINSVDSYVINPLITNSIKNKNIRKVKNDKRDAIAIAKLAKFEDIKSSNYFDPVILDLKFLTHEYKKVVDMNTSLKHKLKADLHMLFTNYNNVFEDIFSATSLKILKEYTTPEKILNANKKKLIQELKITSKQDIEWANKKYNQLIELAKDSKEISMNLRSLSFKVSKLISMIEFNNSILSDIKKEIKSIVNSKNFPSEIKESIDLIDEIPGFDFMTSVILIAEIGDHTRFKKAKELVAFLGIDPAVSQSGKFSATNTPMSKRGSQTGRRALYTAALVSVRKKPDKEYYNKVLHNYYNNRPDKPKKVRLGAVMHKLVNYIFSTLKTREKFIIREPKLHVQMYLENKSKNVA